MDDEYAEVRPHVDNLHCIAVEVAEDATFDTDFSDYVADINTEILGIGEIANYLRDDDCDTDRDELYKLVCLNIYLNSTYTGRMPHVTERDDDNIATHETICQWVKDHIVPSADFAGIWADFRLEKDPVRRERMLEGFFVNRLAYSAGVQALWRLNKFRPIADLTSNLEIITVLCAFLASNSRVVEVDDSRFKETSFEPWCIPRTNEYARKLWDILGNSLDGTEYLKKQASALLKGYVKEIFGRSRSDAITAEARRNLYITERPRFDSALYAPGMKPWKQDAIWILGVLQWIAQWCDEASIFDEDLTALMVPAVLSIIDDDAITFKARGCDILRHLLRPMKAARSDYLERTNLDDVFVQALKPSLLSLPTLNSEDESVYILSRAYPAICEVVMTRYHMRTPQHSRQGSREIQDGPPARPETNSPSPSEREEFHDEKRFTVLQKLLSDDLTRSYRLTARLDSANGATSASFPYPALSRLLLEEMILVISLMKTHVIPRMDDVVETIRLTLTNPFIAADLDLLATALELTRDLVLNAWTRAWDMHIIMLDALTSVWVRLMEDQPEFVTMDQTNGITHTDRDRRAHRQHVSILRWIKATLRGTLASLRIASQENGPALAAKNRRLVELRECGTYDPRRQPESETESSVELSDDEGQQDRWNRLMDEAEGTDNQGERMDADGNDEEEEDGDEGNDDEEDYTEEEGIVWPNANEDEHEREKREELMARRIEAQFQRERKEDFLRFDLEMKALLDNEDRLDELVGWLLKEKDAEGRQAVEAPYAH